jgi:hypothetical protein
MNKTKATLDSMLTSMQDQLECPLFTGRKKRKRKVDKRNK